MGDKLNKYSKGRQVNVDVIVNQQTVFTSDTRCPRFTVCKNQAIDV